MFFLKKREDQAAAAPEKPEKQAPKRKIEPPRKNSSFVGAPIDEAEVDDAIYVESAQQSGKKRTRRRKRKVADEAWDSEQVESICYLMSVVLKNI